MQRSGKRGTHESNSGVQGGHVLRVGGGGAGGIAHGAVAASVLGGRLKYRLVSKKRKRPQVKNINAYESNSGVKRRDVRRVGRRRARNIA